MRELQGREDLPGEEPLLSPQRAFVLQFYPETSISRKQFRGRIEHVLSGQATQFDSLDAILQFLEQLLSQVKDKP